MILDDNLYQKKNDKNVYDCVAKKTILFKIVFSSRLLPKVHFIKNIKKNKTEKTVVERKTCNLTKDSISSLA